MKLTRRGFLRAAAAVSAAGAGGGVYAWRIEPLWTETVHVDVPVRDPSLEGYVIAQISDVHVGCGVPDDHVRDAVARANAARPDLIALTGDFVHRGTDEAERMGALLSGLSAPDGVVACLGNHDAGVGGEFRTPDPVRAARVVSALHDAGVEVLENRTRDTSRDLTVTGIGDLWSKRYRPPPLPDSGSRVVLSHNPDTAEDLARRGADLILSGHTHGGQVRLPFFGAPVLPVRNKRFSAGLFDLGGARLYVNRGIGWLYRVRLFARPEVTILRLAAAEPA